MSRNKDSNLVVTKEKKVKVGRRVIVNGEPQLLTGPESNKDYFSLQDMTEGLYGPGAKYHVDLSGVGK